MKLNLKTKLISLFLLIGLLSIIIVGLLSFNTAKNEIEEQVYENMAMYEEIVKKELESYFHEREGDIKVFASTLDVNRSMEILKNNEYKLLLLYNR